MDSSKLRTGAGRKMMVCRKDELWPTMSGCLADGGG